MIIQELKQTLVKVETGQQKPRKRFSVMFLEMFIGQFLVLQKYNLVSE